MNVFSPLWLLCFATKAQRYSYDSYLSVKSLFCSDFEDNGYFGHLFSVEFKHETYLFGIEVTYHRL